jgi:beta-barrel assembly-enhancing protease
MRRLNVTGMFSALMLVFLSAQPLFSQRTELKPGKWNLFSPQQDVELGRSVALDAEKKLPMLGNARVDDYLTSLGKKLAAVAPGEKYPYEFKCVNDTTINAFALPGGFLFVHRGTIESADNEAELAGVIGHEIGHVALRHGTNQATKEQLAQAPAAVLGIIFKGNPVAQMITRLGAGFTANSVLLKYSRDDERQSDLMGAQILYDCGYNPIYMAQFFEKLGKGRGTDFFSSHPNPENRIQNINNEIDRIGTPRGNPVSDSREFQSIRSLVKSLPPAPKNAADQTQTSGSPNSGQQGHPPLPSGRYRSYNAANLTIRHPDNWKAYGEDQAFTLAPESGVVQVNGSETLAYGAMMAVHLPTSSGRSRPNLREATDQLVAKIQDSNSGMRISKDQGQIRVGGEAAMSKLFGNDSPVGGREMDWLVTILRPEGLVYFIFVAPEKDFGDYQNAFRRILDSVTFR